MRLSIFARVFTIAFSAVVIAIAGFAHGALAQDEDWNKVIAEAKKEGKLVLYTAYVGQKSTKDIAAAFEKKYGISVEVLEGRASEIRERVRVEQSAGRYAADVMFTSEGQTKLYDREDKTVAPLPTTPARAGVKKQFHLQAPMAAVMSIPYGILINTNIVKPADEPKTWADVADPKWKGKILADDTRAVGGGYLWYFATYNALGEDYHNKVAANAPVFNRDQRESHRRVARGEYPLYLPMILPDMLSLKGLPVKAIVPPEGVPYVLYGNIVLKNAPHPNAAKLYVDFLQTREAQLFYAQTGHGYVIDGLEKDIPEDVRPISGVKLMGTTDPDKQNEMIELAKKIYK
jgi:iron(III) transport system substrate-binding protein